jgi:hypothetical protein
LGKTFLQAVDLTVQQLGLLLLEVNLIFNGLAFFKFELFNLVVLFTLCESEAFLPELVWFFLKNELDIYIFYFL